MNLEQIKRVITDQRAELERKFKNEHIIDREGQSVNKKYLKKPFVFITTGIRRCGKSIFSILLAKDKKYGYLNFDDERLRSIDTDDLDKVIEAMYYLYDEFDYIILDEIQNVSGWELFVNRLQRTKRVLVTGSNAKLMSNELATHLTGRYIENKLYPFSFSEYLTYKKFKPDPYLTSDIARIKKHLDKYLKVGGIPDAYEFGERYLMSLYNDIITRDVITRYRIKYRKAFFELAEYLISNYSNEFSYNKLSNIVEIKNVHTVKNYVSYLENAYIIFCLQRFSFKLKEQNLAPRKIYCIDTGIINAMSYGVSDNHGPLIENLVAVELIRRNSLDPKTMIYYWKDHQQREVDFIIKKGNRIMECIQVTYASSENEIHKREISSLTRASKELKCKNLTVITWDYEDNKSGIKHVPLWKWLILKC